MKLTDADRLPGSVCPKCTATPRERRDMPCIWDGCPYTGDKFHDPYDASRAPLKPVLAYMAMVIVIVAIAYWMVRP